MDSTDTQQLEDAVYRGRTQDVIDLLRQNGESCRCRWEEGTWFPCTPCMHVHAASAGEGCLCLPCVRGRGEEDTWERMDSL